MVEIEQEEIERLRAIETAHNVLLEEHEKLKGAHSTLQSDYIELSKGQRGNQDNKSQVDEFDAFCKQKFGR